MKNRIKNTIERTFEITDVDEDISQANCEKWDSMNHLNLIIELETEFEVSFEPEEIAEMTNYMAIIKVINSKRVS